ncbi:sulfatase-like hydrolase/transferase [Bradyrhizobium manausense]|uniref:sulfatase-like hydrolase/transferase n=1 Tax=Bradyrhizobium manausense TaxID=989370 RepID=UPI001BA4AA65|nr:sulfatase-like hydrolase/transferase [Bradyrhizobium manausense]MBR0787637.1 sulfatase-like hydrolase/transferase [Bradyrhizobium manausense]
MAGEPALQAGQGASAAASKRGTSLAALKERADFWLAALLHLAALALSIATEVNPLGLFVCLLTWIVLNSVWLTVVRRPIVAALVSLEMFVVLILLSKFKFDKLWMTLDFIDVLIVDRDTTTFLLATFPALRWWIVLGAAATAIAIVVAWRLDRARVGLLASLLGLAVSATGLVVTGILCPTGLDEDFEGKSYVSKFARTGIEAVQELSSQGFIQAANAVEGGDAPVSTPCRPSRKLPHILLVHDESSFEITSAPGIKVPAGYDRHFKSFDGKARKLLVEGVGGPSWFAEFNVLTGLSVRSFGRFATSVTRIASGHVFRGLAHTLRDCGYQTFSLYPFYGSFLGSRAFQTSVGIDHYLDMRDLGTTNFEADSFYFQKAIDLIDREGGARPLFLYVYTVANHFPWNERLRRELTPDWRDLGNAPEVDEYIRRQGMSASDYQEFLAKLKRSFPTEQFLIVRYGDHQPQFGARLLDPGLSKDEIARRARQLDPRYLTTYYAIDALNFTPRDISSALDTVDAPYLPLIILEAAGVPLDATFSMQRQILQDCGGLFYRCQQSIPSRRLNRQLMDLGLIKGF